MRNIIGILVAIVVVIAILIFAGILDLSPEGERALQDAQENVGQAIENTGQAIQSADN